MNSIPTSPSAKPPTSAPSRSEPLFKKWKSLILNALKSIPYTFKKWNKHTVTVLNSSNSKIRQTVKKLHAILISHRLVNHAPVLVKTKNIAKKGVIWRGEDVKQSKAFLNQLSDPSFYEKKDLKPLSSYAISHLKNVKIEGAVTEGICFGASLSLIKALTSADIKSENALLAFVSQYKNGFSAEAAGLQTVHESNLKFNSHYPDEAYPIELEKINERYIVKKNQLLSILEEKAKTLSPDDLTKYWNETLKKESDQLKVNELAEIKRLDRYYKTSNDLHHIAALIDLEISGKLENHKKAFLYRITSSKSVQKKFNQLEIGYHQLSFYAHDKNRHAIVYIKKEFGSYLHDSNFGLFKCDPNNPAEKLCELLKTQYPGKSTIRDKDEKDNFLEIYGYALYSN